jgi:hypothetical protein
MRKNLTIVFVWIAVVSPAVVIFLLAGRPTPIETSTGKVIRPSHIPVYEQGVRARREGVPANANPFTSWEADKGKVWLDGWMDAKPSN